MFTLAEGFRSIRYTFIRQRHVAEKPGIYLIICRTAITQGKRGLYVGQANNLRTCYVEHYNESRNEQLRLLIVSCVDLEFAWLPVCEQERLTEMEQCFITRYKDVAINLQFL